LAGEPPLRETLAGFEALLRNGLVKSWGVSNFDVEDMEELVALPGGGAVATNQVLYNLAKRGIEADLVPWSRARGIPIMAYSPIDQGRILRNRTLSAIAARHGATPAQIALAWVLRHRDMMVIPKATNEVHVRENRAALDLELSTADLAELARAFPSPSGATPLEKL
jgi:diketogulonate reductase-like aldo/keto reductase